MADNAKKDTYEISSKEFVGQVDKSKKFSGWYYDDQQRLFDAGRLTTISLHANSTFNPKSHENGLLYSQWSYDTPSPDDEDAKDYYPFGNYLRDGESAKANDNVTQIRTRGYYHEPLCTAIINEDVAVNIANAWSDMGGDMAGELWKGVRQYAPYASSIVDSVGGIMENLATRFLSDKFNADGTLKDGSTFSSAMVDIASAMKGIGRAAQLDTTHEIINDYLNRALVMQGTRFSYYGGTGINFNNMVMKFTIFPTWRVQTRGKNKGQVEFVTVPAQIAKLYPYFIGEYVDESLFNSLRSGLGDYIGWECPPGGFRAALKDIDNVQKGTLKLKIGSLYSISNLVVENVMMNFSKEVVKCPDPKFFTTEEIVTDSDGKEKTALSKSLYGLVTPLYCEITLQLKPATKYSSQSIRKFFNSANMAEDVYKTELGMLNTLRAGQEEIRKRFVTDESKKLEEKRKFRDYVSERRLKTKQKEAEASVKSETASEHLSSSTATASASAMAAKEAIDKQRNALSEYDKVKYDCEEKIGGWETKTVDEQNEIIAKKLYEKSNEEGILKENFEKFKTSHANAADQSYKEYLEANKGNPDRLSEEDYKKQYFTTEYYNQKVGIATYSEVNNGARYNTAYEMYKEESQKAYTKELEDKYDSDPEFHDKVRENYDKLSDEEKRHLSFDEYFSQKVIEKCKEDGVETTKTISEVDFNNFLVESKVVSNYSDAETLMENAKTESKIKEILKNNENYKNATDDELSVAARVYRETMEQNDSNALMAGSKELYLKENKDKTEFDWEFLSSKEKTEYVSKYYDSVSKIDATSEKRVSVVYSIEFSENAQDNITVTDPDEVTEKISALATSRIENSKKEIAEKYNADYNTLGGDFGKTIEDEAIWALATGTVESDLKDTLATTGQTAEEYLISKYGTIDRDCLEKYYMDKYVRINAEVETIGGDDNPDDPFSAKDYSNYVENVYKKDENFPDPSTEIPISDNKVYNVGIDYNINAKVDIEYISYLKSLDNEELVNVYNNSSDLEDFSSKATPIVDEIIKEKYNSNKYADYEIERYKEIMMKELKELYSIKKK